MKLGPLGVAIVELAADQVDVVDLNTELERRFGTPPTGGSEQATRQAVADLIEIGMLGQVNEPPPSPGTRDPE